MIIDPVISVYITNRNYGMYSASNVVKLNNIASDLIPTSISADVDKDSTSNISLASTANLTTFENVGVGTTNAGYVLINGELISYTGVSGNSLEGISRNIDNTGVVIRRDVNSRKIQFIKTDRGS